MTLPKTLSAALLAAAAAPALAADTYVIDVDHTHPSFEFPHLGISWWRGIFGKADGTVTLDRKAKSGTVDITVDTGSIAFGHDKLREHALGENWFNVAKFPTATYKGTIKFDGDTPSAVDGQLTLLGVTRPVLLKINSFKCIEHPFYKKEVCGADAEGELNRADFGMTRGAQDGKAPVKLRIQVEGLKQ